MTLILSICIFLQFNYQNLDYGIYLLQAGDYPKACDFFEGKLRENPYCSDAYLYLSLAYVRLDSLDKALSVLERGISFFPKDEKILRNASLLALDLKKFGKAIKWLESLKRLTPRDTSLNELLGIAHFNQGVEFYQSGKNSAAIDAFYKSLSYDKNKKEIYQNLCILLLEENELTRASSLIEEGIARFPNDPVLLRVAAEIKRRNNDYKGMTPILEKLCDLEPDDIEISLTLALIYRHEYRLNDALSVYERLKKRFPKNREIYDAEINYWLSILRYNKVRDVYKQLLLQFPGDREILLQIAKTYEYEENWDEAIRTYKEMQKLYPSDTEILCNQAKIYENIGDLVSAESLYKKLIELNKLDAHPYTRLGAIYEEKGDTLRAKDLFETSIRLGTEDPLPFVRLAHIYIKTGAMDKGLRFIKIGLEEIIRYMGPIQQSLIGGEIKGLDEMREVGERAKEVKSKESLLREILTILTENYSDKVVEDELTILLKRFPNSPVLLEWFADFYEKGGDLGAANLFLEKFLKIRPDSKGAYISRGNILLAKGDTTGAIISYRRAIELGADNDSIYLTLISIYRNRDELDTLRKMWKMDLQRKHSDKLNYYLEQISEKEPSQTEVH